MTNLLIRLFIKNREDIHLPEVRQRYGMLSGFVGLFCNLLLSIAKFFIGTFTKSIAITADALNNLSDAGSSVVTLAGFRISGKPADDEHPFGHGRLEYIVSLVISFLVLLMGIELIKSSFQKILNPEPLRFSFPAMLILLLSILVKIWMALFNRKLGEKIHSPATKAIVVDSLSDTAATGVSVLALILSKFTAIPLDGYMGAVVAVLILCTGVSLLKDTIGPLLGESPDPALVTALEEKILSYPGIVGVHDLMIHNYGPNRIFASAHAEVPANVDIMTSHDTVDLAERRIAEEFHLTITLHMDPIITDDQQINTLHLQTARLVKEIDPQLNIHDFRVVDGPTHTNLIFDLVRPHQFAMKDAQLRQAAEEKLSALGDRYFAVITIECSYS